MASLGLCPHRYSSAQLEALTTKEGLPKSPEDSKFTNLTAEQKEVATYIEKNAQASTGVPISDITRKLLSIGGKATTGSQLVGGIVGTTATATGATLALALAGGPAAWIAMAAGALVFGTPMLLGQNLVFEPTALDVGNMLKGPNEIYHENVRDAAEYLVEINQTIKTISKEMANRDAQKERIDAERNEEPKKIWNELIQVTQQLSRVTTQSQGAMLEKRQAELFNKLKGNEAWRLAIVEHVVDKPGAPYWTDEADKADNKPEVKSGT
jgi:hypothetical protein